MLPEFRMLLSAERRLTELVARRPGRRFSSSNSPTSASADQEQKRTDSQHTPEIVDRARRPRPPMSSAMQRRAQILKTELPKSMFKYRPALPTNLSYPNQKGVEFFEEDVRVGDLPKEFKVFKDYQVEKFKEEWNHKTQLESPDMANDLLGARHNQLCIDYEFKTDKDMSRWRTGCDSDWDEGFSTVKLERTDTNTALFSGYLDTQPIKDGRTDKAGWASMKSVDLQFMNRKNFQKHWNMFNHLVVKCRGDGRSYKLILYTPGYVDVLWGDTYTYPLHTHGGPYWQYTRIPFSRFFSNVGGRIQDVQMPMTPHLVSNVGIVMMDRTNGPFRLEVAFIGVLKDNTYVEEHSYEAYSIPVFNVNSL